MFWNLGAIISGAIFYQELASLSAKDMAIFFTGVFVLVVAVTMTNISGARKQRAADEAANAAAAVAEREARVSELSGGTLQEDGLAPVNNPASSETAYGGWGNNEPGYKKGGSAGRPSSFTSQSMRDWKPPPLETIYSGIDPDANDGELCAQNDRRENGHGRNITGSGNLSRSPDRSNEELSLPSAPTDVHLAVEDTADVERSLSRDQSSGESSPIRPGYGINLPADLQAEGAESFEPGFHGNALFSLKPLVCPDFGPFN